MVFSPDPFVALVKHTKIPLPDVRRRALLESVRRAQSKGEVLDIFLDTASSSPYLSAEHKIQLANSLLNDDTKTLVSASLAPVSNLADTPSNNGVSEITQLWDSHQGILEMARLLLVRSRKVQALPTEHRRQLIMSIQQAQSEDQVVDLVLNRLPTALSLDTQERHLVATDILDHRYYRLLLPDRLHCEEPRPRLDDGNPQQTQRECPICLDSLGNYGQTKVLPCCGQRFCSACIAAWSQRSTDCPLCQTALPIPLTVALPLLPTPPSRKRSDEYYEL